MKKRIVSITLALIIAFGLLLLPAAPQAATSAASGTNDVRDDARGAIAKVAEIMEAAEPIRLKLNEIISEEIEGFEIDDDSEYNSDDAYEALDETDGYSEQLRVLLAGLNGLPEDPETSDGKTVLAAREYLSMLLYMTTDLSELIGYSIAFTDALALLENMDNDTDSYQGLAYTIMVATDSAIEALEHIVPPVYLAISHNDVIIRIKELGDFADDFFQAALLEDPLRIYSCIYRLDRIVRMLSTTGDNLSADLLLQMRQAERRIHGPIDVLHGELMRNLAILTEA